jgi:mannose-6-phosphate isomerase-like protein (cupin superfamily)
VAYTIIRPEERKFAKPSWRPDDPARTLVELPLLAELKHSRAHLWRYPPAASGHRHRERVQEEVFVVLEGTLSMELGDEPERVDLPQGSIAVVEPGTALRVFNDGHEDVLVFACGAPAEPGTADILERAW